MTPSFDPGSGDGFGDVKALVERSGRGRRLEDRIAERDAERQAMPSHPAAAAVLMGQADRRSPGTDDRRRGDANAKANYARFIPREELGQVSSWQLGNFDQAGGLHDRRRPLQNKPEAPLSAQELQRREQEAAARRVEVKAARDAGYADGHRDGMAALEAFKTQHARQTTAQMEAVLARFQEHLDQLEIDLARRVAGIALVVAKQVVRRELQLQPEAVVSVCQEAIEQLLLSARHVTVLVHPEDQAFIQEGAGDLLAARHARLVPDAHLQRGDCVVQADTGGVDGTLAMRWTRVMESMGADVPWQDDAAPPASAPAQDAQAPGAQAERDAKEAT